MKTAVQGLPSLLLRIPLCSVNQPLELFDGSNRQLSANWLREFYEQPIHQQALYLASPALHEVVHRWLQTTETTLTPDIELSLAKYAIRSATRATPFGLFAGLCIAKLSDTTNVVLLASKINPFTRLDSSALVQLYEQILATPELRRQLRFSVTNSKYYTKGQYRYSEFTESGEGRNVVMSSLDADDYLDKLVDFAQVYRSFNEIEQFIAGMAQVSSAEAGEYIDTLINDKFLLSELEPTVTGIPYINRLKNWILTVNLPDEQLQWILNQPDVLKEPIRVPILQKADRWLNQHGVVSANQQSFWQTNLWFNAESACFAQPVINQIGSQLSEIFPALERTSPGWVHGFVQRFRERYQGQSVPLLQVLDNESGLGLRPAGEYLSSPAPRAEQLLTRFDPVPSLVQHAEPGSTIRRLLLERVRRSSAMECELTPADLPETGSSLTGYWSVLGTLLGSDPALVDSGQYDYLLRTIHVNSTALVGRFCQDSDELTSMVRTIHQEQSDQFADCVLAEVVHLAGARSGNVNVRPMLRSYEIPYLTPASVPDEYVINLSDLWVSVSDNNEISLFSSRLNKRVIPQLTTAHNVAHGDEIYQFLCGVAHQQNSPAYWSWKEFSKEPFLPRVRYKKLIVARAQWHVSAVILGKFDKPQNCWQWFSENYLVPRYAMILSGDNELLLDTSTPLGKEFIFNELSKRKKITLVEWLSVPERCWVRDASGQPYAHEALLFFESPANYVTSTTLTPSGKLTRMHQTGVVRQFLPGSEWLYLKLYTGPETANLLLRGPIRDLLMALSQQDRIQNWFFVRYLDPEFHLRLRIRCVCPHSRATTMMEVLAVCQQLVTDGFVGRVQIDTYEREFERYGELTIGLCEEYFRLDTQMILDFMIRQPDADEESSILFAVANAIVLAADFGFSDRECLTFFRLRQQAYHREYSINKSVKNALNQQFRDYRSQMNIWGLSIAGDLLQKRSLDTRQLIDNLKLKMQVVESTDLFPLTGSLLHMSMNRLFTSQLRLYELMVYHLTCRYYESIIARSKNVISCATT